MAFLRKERTRVLLLLIAPVVLLSCRVWSPAPERAAPIPATPTHMATVVRAQAAVTPQPETDPDQTGIMEETAVVDPVPASLEPAGCLVLADQAQLGDGQAMLAYADRLLALKRPLSERLLPESENWHSGSPLTAPGAISLEVADVQNEYMLQRMLDALQVAGFVAVLRNTPSQGLHILAIPLLAEDLKMSTGTSPWYGYVESYWQTASAPQQEDAYILAAQKTPPCAWMVAQGFAPPPGDEWRLEIQTAQPNYAAAATAYLASTSAEAVRVARRIDWLQEGLEGANTMCGPLSWTIMKDAGAFPPGWGGWLAGAKAFWLASPRDNGRPWSLFPEESFRLYSFKEPLGRFDFHDFPLYPGDFLFTYSFKDGFDHMLVVTETGADGSVYTVTNLVQTSPEQKVSIERVLLLNINDSSVGIARNQWARDKINGRTGHDGFDVFRWAWAEKNALGQPSAYTVRPGDTLDRVAAFWRTPAGQIARYNQLEPDRALAVGQSLSIPPVDSIQP